LFTGPSGSAPAAAVVVAPPAAAVVVAPPAAAVVAVVDAAVVAELLLELSSPHAAPITASANDAAHMRTTNECFIFKASPPSGNASSGHPDPNR
jgi:hypothetical protein